MPDLINTIISEANWQQKSSPYNDLMAYLPSLADQEITSYIPKIDDQYVLNHDVTKYILAGLIFNQSVLINGLHGVGKSTHIEQVCARLGYPVLRLNMDAMIDRSDLVGRDGVINVDGNNVTAFQIGALTWSLQQPIVLIIDELDMADHNILMLLQKILEHDSFNLLEENKIIPLHQYFRIFATSNTLGDGDDKGIYSGANFINQAHLDRWDMVVAFNNQDAASLITMLQQKYPKWKKTDIKKIIKLYQLLYDAFANNLINQLFSVRNLLSFCNNYTILNQYNEAFLLSYANKLHKQDLIVVKELWQRVFNEELLLKPV